MLITNDLQLVGRVTAIQEDEKLLFESTLKQEHSLFVLVGLP